MSDSDTRPSRPVFFDRQSLTRDDLNAVVAYVRDKARRHNRVVVGFGVACGLRVTPVDGAPWLVQVGPGHALMPSGEEVSVPEDARPFDICAAARTCLGIPGPCPTPLDPSDDRPVDSGARSTDFTALPDGSTGPNPRDIGWARIEVFSFSGRPDATRIETLGPLRGLDLGVRATITLDAPADAVEIELGHSAIAPVVIARNAAGATLDTQAVTVDDLTPQVLRLEGTAIERLEIDARQNEALLLRLRVPSTARGQVYLALCPDEKPSAFRPGLPPHCQPPGDNIHPSRICEGYRFEILCDLPEGHRPPDCASIEEMICGPDHVPGPPRGGPDCVVIATLSVGADGIVAIDEFANRRRVLPQWVLAERAVCLCDVAPPPTPTAPPPTRTPSPTIFTQLPTDFTLVPSIFTLPTDFTLVPSIFTLPTDFTLVPSIFTLSPSTFTRLPSSFTLGPTRFTGPVFASDFVSDPIRPVDFNPNVGRELPVNRVQGIGRARAATLNALGVNTVTDLVERDTTELAAALGLSEVRVAELQDIARRLTLGPER
jgi:hypothetical protein